jgi:hypothetical protein
MCESNVQTWLNPYVSARFARSITRAAGGVVCNTSPISIQRVSGKPRSMVLVAGSGQRLVTTLARV